MAVTILSIIQVLIGVVLIVFVLGQSGKHSGLGMISGTSDSFLSKNRGKSGDAKLARSHPGPQLPALSCVSQNALPFGGAFCVNILIFSTNCKR